MAINLLTGEEIPDAPPSTKGFPINLLTGEEIVREVLEKIPVPV